MGKVSRTYRLDDRTIEQMEMYANENQITITETIEQAVLELTLNKKEAAAPPPIPNPDIAKSIKAELYYVDTTVQVIEDMLNSIAGKLGVERRISKDSALLKESQGFVRDRVRANKQKFDSGAKKGDR